MLSEYYLYFDGTVEALPDLHQHVPASAASLISLRRGAELIVRVDTVEALHVVALYRGGNVHEIIHLLVTSCD